MCNVGSDDKQSPLQAMACDQAARAGGVNTAVEAPAKCPGCGAKATAVNSVNWKFYSCEAAYRLSDHSSVSAGSFHPSEKCNERHIEQLRDALELAVRNMNVYASNAGVPEDRRMTADRLIALGKAMKLSNPRVLITKTVSGGGHIVLEGEVFEVSISPFGKVTTLDNGKSYLGLGPADFEWYEGE